MRNGGAPAYLSDFVSEWYFLWSYKGQVKEIFKDLICFLGVLNLSGGVCSLCGIHSSLLPVSVRIVQLPSPSVKKYTQFAYIINKRNHSL